MNPSKQNISLVFNIDPVAQLRPRARRTKFGVQVYDQKPVRIYKRQIRMMARFMYKGKPLDGPLRVEMSFYRHPPESNSKVEKKRKISGQHRPIVKPDISNEVKAFEDGLNGIIWTDDNLIVDEISHEYYDMHPHITLEVTVIGENFKQN